MWPDEQVGNLSRQEVARSPKKLELLVLDLFEDVALLKRSLALPHGLVGAVADDVDHVRYALGTIQHCRGGVL